MTVVEPLDPSGYGDEALGIRSAQSVTYNATYGETFTETLIMFRVGRAFGLTSTVMFNRQVDADEQTTALAASSRWGSIPSTSVKRSYRRHRPPMDARTQAERAPPNTILAIATWPRADPRCSAGGGDPATTSD